MCGSRWKYWNSAVSDDLTPNVEIWCDIHETLNFVFGFVFIFIIYFKIFKNIFLYLNTISQFLDCQSWLIVYIQYFTHSLSVVNSLYWHAHSITFSPVDPHLETVWEQHDHYESGAGSMSSSQRIPVYIPLAKQKYERQEPSSVYQFQQVYSLQGWMWKFCGVNCSG